MSRIVRDRGSESIVELLNITGEAYLLGYWQSEEYFHDYEKEIRSTIGLDEVPEL